MSASHRPLWLLFSAVLGVSALLLGRGALLGAEGRGESQSTGYSRTTNQPSRLHQPSATAILIDSVLFDGYALGDADEAVRLVNAGTAPVYLLGWQLSDGGTGRAALPPLTLSPGAAIWLARDAAAFRFQFGREPDGVLSAWPGFTNTGDEVVLLDPGGVTADALVYLAGDATTIGWLGPALAPYRVAALFAAEGQIVYRRRDPISGAPVVDTNTAADWAQSTGDVVYGRKVRYPGWESDRFRAPVVIAATATLTVAIAPDNAYDAIVGAISRARSTIRLSSLTLEHVGIGEALAAAARRGVAVTALLEGAPPGGLINQERYVCGLLERAGGACWFMMADDDQHIHDRYRYLHAKYLIIDSRLAAVSSENFSPDSMPNDDKADGTLGRRGVVLLTDAAGVAAHLTAIFAADLDTAHSDIRRWSADDPVYGLPPPGFVPDTESGGAGYTVRFPRPVSFSGPMVFEITQAPENGLRDVDGLLGLVGRAGEGDTLLIEQLAERAHWGATTSNPSADPNPRLEAYLDAARRGAEVTLLLDSFFEEAAVTANAATCDYVNDVALNEALRLHCRLGNPTGMGIHNKMVLAQIGGHGTIHVGSLNGTELSNKGNREVAVQVRYDAAHDYLAEVFAGDAPHSLFLPVALARFDGAADHVLISEIVYDTPGPDEAEFVELVNPTGSAVSLTGYAIGDAVLMTDFEDMRLFPPGIVLPPSEALVVALSALGFRAEFGASPDLEMVDTDPTVPDLIDLPEWGDPEALFQLGNSGDEVMLLNARGPVDIVTYGDGFHPAVMACPLLAAPARTLERYPFWRDSRNCPADFRAWPFPSPGRLP